ncbi:WD and tetratricopeptide repeats protein 1-like isoform X1 [Schistocerca cancellata]|uniref:WD and tetratricopeptide repeats protein 1-like isoform X1 n=1 Tax=Schistocerca cancellata TaxID=274614 RepID=UPI002119549B|nr:WD and tetratricopeptide repeats protein 1-like isoform X1 [Schistocerca cancellata]
MKRNSVSGRNIAQFVRQREIRETVARHFQQKLHVTDTLVRRLELEATLQGHNGCVNCLEWNAAGSVLASASDDVQIILWDPFKHKKLHTFPSGHHGNVFTVKFLPKTNDRVLVTGAGDCLIRVHDITSSETTHSCSCHTARVKRIATAPSVPYMFWSASEDGTVMQFDLRTSHACSGTVNNLLINLANHVGREAEAKCVAINPLREELLAVGANDPFIRVYDRRMIKLLNKDVRVPMGNRAPGAEVPDNLVQGCVTYFVAGQLPSIQRFYRKNYRNLVSTYITFGPNGRDLLANMGGEQVYIFDISNKRRPKRFEFSDVGLDELKPDDDEGCEHLTEDLMHLDVYAYGEECKEFNRTNGFSFQTAPTQKGFTPPHRIESLKMIANGAYDAKQYTQAISMYNEAISQCPEYAFLYGNRAAAYMRRDWDGDMYAAMRDCHIALQLDPNYVKAHFRLARCLYELQWINEASKCLKAFKVKYPEHSDQPACKALTKDVILAKGYMRDLEEDSGSSDDDSSGPSIPSTDNISPLEKFWRENAYDYEIRFCGHCNTTTDIKEANFFGSDGQFVVAGSDDGSFFIWDRRTTNIIRILRGDDSIVNCLQPHPTYCLLATSGIDPVVRLWAPKPEDGSKNDREVLNLYDAASANQKRMNADPFEVMLINMGYRIQAMRGGNSESSNEGDHPTINCRPS